MRGSISRRAVDLQIRCGCPAWHDDFDYAVIERLVARIACGGQIGIRLGECGSVFRLDRALQFLERLLRNRGYHVRKRDVVLDRMGMPEAIERALQISKLVGCKFPVSIRLRAPEPLVPRLNCRDHQVADARQISGGSRRGRHFRLRGNAARGRKTDSQGGGCGNGDRGNDRAPTRSAPLMRVPAARRAACRA